MNLYDIFYVLMLIGFGGLTCMSLPNIKSFIIGLLLFAVNSIIFWK